MTGGHHKVYKRYQRNQNGIINLMVTTPLSMKIEIDKSLVFICHYYELGISYLFFKVSIYIHYLIVSPNLTAILKYCEPS